MTVVPTAPAGLENYTGLDDLSPSDLSMPRLTIGQGEDAGVFIDGLSGAKFAEVDVIVLGIIKQRILWPPTMGETKSQPLCRSLDFDRGHPDMGNDEFKSKFPWEASGYKEADIAATDDKTIPCDACPLKEWGSHPTPGRDAPWCNEQIVLAILLGPSFSPAILTVQGSGLKPTKTYLSSFVRDKLPPFNCHTTITLDVLTRGQVTYSVPQFAQGDSPVDADLYGAYVTTFEGMKKFVQTQRTREDAAVSSAAAPAPAAKAAAPDPVTPVVDADDEGEIPF